MKRLWLLLSIIIGLSLMGLSLWVVFRVESSDLTFPVLLDESGEAAAAYRMRAIPSSVFVNGDGVITDVFYGSMTKEIIEGSLVKILGG